jgi:hypothetical protein
MAETVRGSIGQEQVFLENAATEATLLKLLEAMQQMGGSGAASKTAGVAGAAGINPATVEKANSSVSGLDKMATGAATGLGNLYNQLISGEPSISGVLAGFQNLPFGIGAVAKGFSMLAQFQETNMKTYQQISQSGANFSGSLTDLRMASANAYVTLEQFGNIIKNNSQTLAKMGGSVNDGAVAFASMSNQLISSPLGSKLLSLGYSTEDVNNSMLNYIANTGGRTKEELANTAKITASTAEYLTELDKVTQFTGVNRKAMEEEQKKAAAQAAFQRKMQSLGEEEKAKLQAAYDKAAASGIAGATDAVMSAALGMPPLTKEAQQLAGTLPDAYNGLTTMTNTAMKTGTTMGDVNKANANFVMGAVQNSQRLGATGDALSLQGNKTITSAIALENQMKAKGIKTADDYNNAMGEISKNQSKQAQSQAADVADAQKTLKEFGQVLLQLINPIVSALTPALKYLGPLLVGLGGAALALKATLIAYDVFMAAKKGIAAAGGGAGGLASAAMGALRGGGGGSPVPPGAGALAGVGGAGAGGGFVGFIRSLGMSLASLAPIAVPMLIGAGAVAGVIALLGAGVAAAIALIGLSLPVFAKGLKDIAEIDGLNLAKVAFGITALGVSIVAFTAGSLIGGLGAIGSKVLNFFSGGGPIAMIKDSILELSPVLPQLTAIGPALNSYSQGIVAFGKAVSGVDLAKAEKLKDVLKGPGVLEGIGSAIKDVGSATAKLVSTTSGGQQNTSSEIAALNNTMKDILRYIKDTAENTKGTYNATKSLNPNLFAA